VVDSDRCGDSRAALLSAAQAAHDLHSHVTQVALQAAVNECTSSATVVVAVLVPQRSRVSLAGGGGCSTLRLRCLSARLVNHAARHALSVEESNVCTVSEDRRGSRCCRWCAFVAHHCLFNINFVQRGWC
jgi:hypothetical protein